VSKVTVVDLAKAEQLSSSEMAKTTGGTYTCQQAEIQANVLSVIGQVYGQMGMTDTQHYLNGEGQGLLDGACP
jgi:hypothetical protein